MRVLALTLLLISASSAAEDADEEGCADHPKLKRPPGYRLASCTTNEASSYEFATGPAQAATKEGRFWDLGYAFKDGAKPPTVAGVVKGVEERVRKLGGKKVFQALEDGAATVSFSMPLGHSQRWLQLEVAPGAEAVGFKIIEVEAAAPKVERTADELKAALGGGEPVPLYGIVFEPEKDRLKPESHALLAEVRALLQTNAGVTLAIEGHVHGGGGPRLNQLLAERRAEAVKKYLVGQGVDAERLETKGCGEGGALQGKGVDDGTVQRWWLELTRR